MPRPRGGWSSPARCRRRRRSTGTPSWSRSLRDTGARVAVDTSEAPLLALLAAGPDAAPHLLKPNAEELAQLAGVSEEEVLRDPAATLAAVRTLHDRGVARGPADPRRRRRPALPRRRRGVVGAAAADHRPQHRRRGRLQPRRLPARRPGRRPAGRATAHRRRVRSGQRVAPRIRRPHPGPGGRRCSTGHRRSTRHQPAPRSPPSRPPAGTSADLRRGLHARTDHHRPGRARRRPGRRQERGRAPAGRTGRRRRPGHRRRRPARRRHGPRGAGAHRPARRHRHPALPLGGGHRGVPRLRPAGPEGGLRCARTARPTWSFLIAAPAAGRRRPPHPADRAGPRAGPAGVRGVAARGDLRRGDRDARRRTSSPRAGRPRPAPAAAPHRPPRRPPRRRGRASSW